MFLLAWTSATVVSSCERRWAVSALLAGIWTPPRAIVNARSADSFRESASETWTACWERYSRVLLASSTLKERVRASSTSM